MAIDVTYQVYTGGRWLPDVTNLNDYAGIYGSPIQGVKANLSSGSIQYRVHTTNGSWLSWVTDRTDYAGIIGQNIDGLQMQVSGLSGYTVKYRVYTGGQWLPWVIGLEDYAGIYGEAIEAIQVEIVAGGGSGGSGDVDVTYKVYTGGRWLPDVTNLSDYAGIYGSAIQGIYANLGRGSIRYKVHTTNGSWLPWVTDRTDYAGILGQNIDGLQMEVINLSGYTVSYRAYVGGRWLPWVKGLEDYAGIFGQAIEAIQVEIITGSSGGSGGGEILPPVSGGRKVFIDPGHGGSDPGAIGNGMNEKDVVFEISKMVGNILTQQGVTVEYSRKSDIDVSLSGRAEMANSWEASLFVSIHANSFGDNSAMGTECFTYPTADSQNKQLSTNVASAISNKLGVINRGHKEADFAVLRLTNMPAILVETAFISNTSDADKLRNRKGDFAMAIATEILKYLGEVPPSFDINDFLRDASNRGFFEGLGKSFQLDLRVLLAELWTIPKSTIEGEVSLTSQIPYPTAEYIDLSEDSKKMAERLYKLLTEKTIEVDFTVADLEISLKHLTLTADINDMIKIICNATKEKTEIILEASYKYNEEVDGYQRLIFTIYNFDNLGYVTVPIALKDYETEGSGLQEYNKLEAISAGGFMILLVFGGIALYRLLKLPRKPLYKFRPSPSI